MLKKEIITRLQAEYDSGKTQEQIAREHNIPHVVINRLLSGKRSVGGLTLDTVCKMFPQMSVNLNGGICKTSVSAENNSIAINGSQNNFFASSDLAEKIISAVMTSDKFDPAAKVELYNIVKELQK